MKQFWINLPVKDVQRSIEFFEKIGFQNSPMHQDSSHLARFFLGEKNVVMMLFPEEAFESFTAHKVSDTATGSEILLNIDAESREEVDAMAERVREAGGRIYAEPGESQGWMYAFGFIDPDGHRWSMLHMDMTKMPG